MTPMIKHIFIVNGIQITPKWLNLSYGWTQNNIPKKEIYKKSHTKSSHHMFDLEVQNVC
jgi:hypothetical protein